MKSPTPQNKDNQKVGAKLRALRKKQGLTLKEASERSGLALSTISKAELGQVALSYEKFVRLAHALHVDVATLFITADQSRGRTKANLQATFIKDDLSQVQHYNTTNYDYSLLFGKYEGKRMKPMVATIESRSLASFDDFIRHAGQEMVIVLSGHVRVEFETGEFVEVNTHETAYFDSGVGHVYLSLSPEPAKVLVVCCD